MLLVVFQLSCDVIAMVMKTCMSLVHFDPFTVTVKQSFVVSQIVGCPVLPL